ncbi:carbohydrate sulfotransferase 3-like isoform X4 [Mercenaria mercenaria]|uniref:carbohydrate sulfotransferase 3-like isoform X4 n=1 Tax=Mercenaria mercenaria TaxID=6596 RepID=UPI00234EE671|nr:carbohydrate sulfotransferase 3-like isoform X4 [Mercenaria mercenaria]
MSANIKTVFLLAGLFMACLFISLYEVQEVMDVRALPLLSSGISFRNRIKIMELNDTSGSTQTAPSPVLVLVLTYMRSGSSLTGDILQHSPGAFFVYEPFRAIGRRNTSTYTISYANGTQRNPPFSFIKEASDGLYNWFTCNLTRLPVIGLVDNFLKKGLKTSMFRPCLEEEYLRTKHHLRALQICVKKLQSICEDSPIRIIKTIRLEFSSVKHLLEELPNLKIVHLVRDPRATLLSQSRFGACKSIRGGWQGCANRHCKRLENDVLEVEGLIKKYPNRILPVMYENIAKHPLETSKKMYEFIGADFTFEAETYIYNITMAGNENNCAICTTRSNSSEHVDTWKRKMKRDFLSTVNERCNYVLKRYQFDEFPVQ